MHFLMFFVRRHISHIAHPYLKTITDRKCHPKAHAPKHEQLWKYASPLSYRPQERNILCGTPFTPTNKPGICR